MKLTDEQIEHLWDTRVGEPSEKYSLKRADKLNFARAIEAELEKHLSESALWQRARQAERERDEARAELAKLARPLE